MGMLEAILRRPRTVITVMLLMLVAGVAAYLNLPKENQPAIDIPYFYVSVTQSGLSPLDADRLLVRPLQTELNNIDGLKSMRSTAFSGGASIVLEFDINFNKEQALQDIKDQVDRAKKSLPGDATDPTVTEISISDFGAITVALYGGIPDRALYRFGRELKDKLESIPEVMDVKMSGERKEVLEVTLDLLKMESYNLTTAQLFDALARNNMVVPAGALDTGQGRFSVEVPGLIQTAQDVYNLPIKTDGNSVVTFSDVATIQRTFKDASVFTRVNGKPALILSVNKRLGANIVKLSEAVRKITDDSAKSWPVGLGHSYMLDQAAIALNMFGSLQFSVLTAVVLVIIVSVALLGIRPALMIGLSIPLSFMMAFLFLQFMGMTVNMMIMFGLILTVGMLVDAAIVVVEYAERKISEGMSRKEAFIRSTRMMFWPIASSTATTLAAFLPLLFWPGIIGKFMSYLPIMVIVTLSASFITAMIFLPVVGGLVARTKVSKKEHDAAMALNGSEHFDLSKIKGMLGLYVRFLAFLVKRPLFSLVVGIALIGSIYVAYFNNPTGMVAFPKIEPQYATVAVTGRGNYSPVQIRDILIRVEKAVLPVAGIKDIVLNFGSRGAVASVPSDTIGNLQLELKPYKDRRSASKIFAEIRQRTANIYGVGVELIKAEEGPPTGKDINLRVSSTNYDELIPAVTRVRDFLENKLGNTIDIEDSRPLPGIDWKVTIDREKAARFGIGVRELSPYVQLVTTGVNIGSYRPNDATDELDIRVRLPKSERSFSVLDSLHVVTSAGLVPVSNFIKRQAVPKVPNVKRWDRKFYMSIGANVTGEDPKTGKPVFAQAKVDQLKAWVATQTWPKAVAFTFRGADKQTNETNQFMMQAGIGALFLMFLILLTQFNSFYQVFITLSTVIMSTAGVLLGMLITGQPFSAIMTGIGIVSLAGVVVNNSIVLIDTFNRLRGEDVDPVTAILMTAAQRTRPVILTTVTTIFGLLPMALGISINFFGRSIEFGAPSGAWWTSLSTALVSGLAFSSLLTLVLVPVLLTAPSIWKVQIGNGWARSGRMLWAIGNIPDAIGRIFAGRRKQAAPLTAKGQIEIPENIDSAQRYVEADKGGLVETESNGVIIVSRQAAE